jgi:hypothetical protein
LIGSLFEMLCSFEEVMQNAITIRSRITMAGLCKSLDLIS